MTAWRAVPPWERRILLVALAVALLLRLVAWIAADGHVFAGDEIGYDADARLFADGQPFWSTTPYGIPHESAWKAPGYWVWTGIGYWLTGNSARAVTLAQVVLVGPAIVLLTWLLARRVFDARVAAVAVGVAAIYPSLWQFDVLLYPDPLATLATLALLIAVLGRRPTARRAAVAGALLAANLYMRPTAMFLFAGVALAWWLTAGLRAGTRYVAITAGTCVLLIAPWTVRNYVVTDAFIPISVQQAAVYGTFNPDSANDPVRPYAWRPLPPSALDLLHPKRPLSEAELQRRAFRMAREYVRDHPLSLLEAFYWNGLTRLWDVRRPARALDEVRFEGRTREVTMAGLAMYYLLLPLAVAGLWLSRRRREIVLPVIAIVLVASMVFTVTSGTRYRLTMEPLVVVFAASALVAASRTAARHWPRGAARRKRTPVVSGRA